MEGAVCVIPSGRFLYDVRFPGSVLAEGSQFVECSVVLSLSSQFCTRLLIPFLRSCTLSVSLYDVARIVVV